MHFQQLVSWTGIECYRITLYLKPVNLLLEMNDWKVVFVFKFLSEWYGKCN